MILLLLGLISTVASRLSPRRTGSSTRAGLAGLKPAKSQYIKDNGAAPIDIPSGSTLTILGGKYQLGTDQGVPYNSNDVFAINGDVTLKDSQGVDGIRLSGINAAGKQCSLTLETSSNTGLILEDFQSLEIIKQSGDFPKISVQKDSTVNMKTIDNSHIRIIQMVVMAEFNVSADVPVSIDTLVMHGKIENIDTKQSIVAYMIEIRDESVLSNIELITHIDVFRVHVTFNHCVMHETLVVMIIMDGEVKPCITLIDQEEFICSRLEVNLREEVTEFPLIEGFDNETAESPIDLLKDVMWFYPSTNEKGYEYAGYASEDRTTLMITADPPEPVPAWIIATVILACILAVFLVYFFVYRKKEAPEISIPIKNDQSMDPSEDINLPNKD